ncbi:NAD(P)-dependent alcohol dehydrogenase, partial [Jatrophihabitans endophyticus]|uniref:NAD(P)-dependent alcohol dehydrogenase n=1 Tax=Jatrophihabitans endophyticus TaxID=1206085 RepID=UPI0019DF4CDF
RIKIAFAGICHSDIHTGRGEWGEVNYPLVPGHEIAGVVEEVGSEVTKFSVGDHAGVGCMVSSCGHCENCTNDMEQFCTDGGMVGTYDGVLDGKPTAGGYSQQIVVDENYTLHIPDGIPLDEAAPLLCAGITLYSPLHHWEAGPGKQVAILGMGGLGHMGVKIAHAMGAEVTVLSQTTSKKEDGEKFGADHYYATSDDETFTSLAGSFDLIVNTVSAHLPMDKFLGLLAVDGTLVNVGAPSEPLEVPAFSLIAGRKSWAGSQIGGIAETQEMLDFCAEHGIAAQVETISADDIDEAYDRVVDSDVKYRFVIDAATI